MEQLQRSLTHNGPSDYRHGVADSESRAEGALLRASVAIPYVPWLLIRQLAEAPNEPSWAQDGSMVFVDISGFTALSERLAKIGKEGAEELTDAIGSCFAALLAVAYANGGGLLKFGGDALLLWYSGEGHLGRAVRSAVWMRQTLRDVGTIETTAGGTMRLRMSVGVHTGTFHFFVVGGSHKELIVTGPAATRTVEMENAASAGQILVSADAAAALPDRLLGQSLGAGRLLARAPSGIASLPLDPPPDAAPEIVEACIPLPVREGLFAGIREPEHRTATVAFIHFEGTDELVEREGIGAVDALDTLVRVTQDAVDERDLCFLGTDIDKDGGKFILSGGAPRAHGDDEERMLLALRRIVQTPLPLPIRIGVNRGSVFAGDIGPQYRRTYTVMGDTVNLAARLMARADPGTIVASPDVLARSRTTFALTELEPFLVKGKAAPVHASFVGPVQEGARERPRGGHVALVGRDAELGELRPLLLRARGRAGHLVELVGEPGIGKTRILEALEEEADDFVLLPVACELYAATTAYHPFRGPLRRLVGISGTSGDDEVLDRLRTLTAVNAPALLGWLPLVAAALDIEAPPTPETAALAPEFRRPRLEQTLVDLLAALLPTPTLVAIEDAQWMDDASAGLLAHLMTRLAGVRWLVVVTRRDERGGFVAPRDDENVTTLRVEPLEAAAGMRLIRMLSADEPLRPHVEAAVLDRAGGNPLFLSELVAAARGASDLDELPGSVEGLVTARVDGLEAPDRNLLRRASVLGLSFDASLVPAVLDADTPAPDESAWRRLAEMVEHDRSGVVRFRSSLVRDAAYAGLPFRLRRELHARVGETVAAIAPNPDEEAELLSFHFHEGRRFREAWRFSRLAGERATAKFAQSEARAFLRRALEEARHVDVSPRELATVWESLGDVEDRLGDFAAADAAYARARAVLNDPVKCARVMLKQAWMADRVGRFQVALARLTKARALLDDAGSRRGARAVRAQVGAWEAAVRYAQGRFKAAVEAAERAGADAKAAKDRSALAKAWYLLDMSLWSLGRGDEAVHTEDSLRIYEELGDVDGQGGVMNNLGGYAYWRGEWDRAVDLYERGREARVRTGNTAVAAEGDVNVGEILSDQGRLPDAEERLADALRVWSAARSVNTPFAEALMGRTLARQGRFDGAHVMFDRALAAYEKARARTGALLVDVYATEALAFEERAVEALARADAAMSRPEGQDGGGLFAPVLQRARGWALASLGDAEAARAAMEASLAAARDEGSVYEEAVTLEAMSALGDACGVRPDAGALNAARETLARLGVVRVPLPMPPAVNGASADPS